MAVDAVRHSVKWRLVQGLIPDSAMVGIQEPHASDIELLDAATAFAATHKCFPATGDFSRAGGVAIFLRYDIGDVHNATKVDTVPGRVLVVEVPRDVAGDQLIFLSIHNFEVSAQGRRGTVRYIDDCLRRRPQPVIFAVGDWNFPEIDYDTLTTTSRGDTTRGDATRARREWSSFLARFTELAHQQPSRAAETQIANGVVVTQSSLDRAMTTLPPTTLAMTTVHCRAPSIARAISSASYQPASDHLPVRTTLRARPEPPPMQRPIPTWVTRHPLFPAAVVAKRLDTLRLDELSPGGRPAQDPPSHPIRGRRGPEPSAHETADTTSRGAAGRAPGCASAVQS